MKVTFLTGEYPPMQGGIADHTACLAAHLASLDIETSILISHGWQETAQSPHLSTVYPHIPNWGWRCWPAVAAFLAQYRPDILHIQYQAAAFDLGGWVNWLPWYLKKRRLQTRLVTTFHDLRIPYIFPKAGSFRRRSILALAHHSDAVICTDQENLRSLQDQLAIKPQRPLASNDQSTNYQLPITNYQLPHSPLLKHIPLGSNIEPQPPANFDRAAWRTKYGVRSNTLLLAYFGFLNESKGGEELIEALALLRRQAIDAQLLLIGGEVGHADPTNMAYAQRVRALIEAHGLAGFVHRTGYIELPEVSAHLLAADAVVMPYREGVSFRRTSLIAALQHGCPVISTAPHEPGLIPQIQHGKNMLLAPPHQAAALAQTITLLAGNPQLQAQLSQGAKALGKLFEWPKIAAETRDIYQATIAMGFARSRL